MKERIVVSSDHAGFDLKNHLKPFIENLGYEVEDIGTFTKEPVDYPKFTFAAAQRVITGDCRRGVIFCGTGQGDAMVANKVPGIRAALCWDEFTARMSRAHNDANMLVLGGWVTGHRVAEEMVRVWLATPFEGGRHERRIEQIRDIERKMMLGRGKIYDITQTIKPGMLSWPGDQKVSFKKVQFEGVNSLTRLDISAHSGTHLDAPSHILAEGPGVDRIGMDHLLGIARVCSYHGKTHIGRQELMKMPLEGVSRLLLHTGNSDFIKDTDFKKEYISLTEDGARYLVETGVKFVALDYLSIDVFETTYYPVHRVLLEAGAVIVEGVDLSGVPDGDFELICLPLNLENTDGAPARVVLRTL
jgi:RpiB/LacA/LacB family sugar-phosphate isomerase